MLCECVCGRVCVCVCVRACLCVCVRTRMCVLAVDGRCLNCFLISFLISSPSCFEVWSGEGVEW